MKSRQKNGRDSRSRETEVGEKIASTSVQGVEVASGGVSGSSSFLFRMVRIGVFTIPVILSA